MCTEGSSAWGGQAILLARSPRLVAYVGMIAVSPATGAGDIILLKLAREVTLRW